MQKGEKETIFEIGLVTILSKFTSKINTPHKNGWREVTHSMDISFSGNITTSSEIYSLEYIRFFYIDYDLKR